MQKVFTSYIWNLFAMRFMQLIIIMIIIMIIIIIVIIRPK